MIHSPFFREILTLLVVATVVAVAVQRLRLPAVLGFLLAGVVIGPHGAGWLSDIRRIHLLADLGVVLLMLTTGLEFTFSRLRGLGRLAVIGGTLQILLSIGVAMAFAYLRGWTVFQGFFFGSVIALSSTALVLKDLIDRGQLDTTHGRIAVAILVFQDLAVAPLAVLIGGWSASTTSWTSAMAGAAVQAVILLGAVGVVGRWLLPPLLRWVAQTRSRELFFLTAVVVCLGTAAVSEWMGLSPAIGAFLAGLMFANTEYGHQLMGQIIPFRHLFVSIFFVSIGMLFDLTFAVSHALVISGVVGLVLLTNCVVTTVLIMGFGYSPRVALAAGIILAQIGEFSFLLMELGRKSGAVEPSFYQILLSSAVVTMMLTPALFALVPVVLRWAEQIPFFGFPPAERRTDPLRSGRLENHIILCGHGPAGRDLAAAFQEERLPFILLDMSPPVIEWARANGIPAIYGDAANEEVLRRAAIDRARAVVVSFGDSVGMTQVVRIVQRLNPRVFLFVRTRFERDVPELYASGADVVVMEELEASCELNRIVLEYFKVDSAKIQQYLERIRARKELAIEKAILRQEA